MQILFIDNDGGGFADYLDIAEETTIEQFFKIKMSGREPEDYLIRVNRQLVARNYILRDGDRVTVTPTKIEGAGLAA